MTELMERRIYRPAEIARQLGCSRQHAYALLEAGEIPGARRLGVGKGRWIVSRDRFDEWLHGGDTDD